MLAAQSTAAEPKDIATDRIALPESAPLGPSSNHVPSTPAGRLALPDLIGMGDVRRTMQNVSPEDRIEWEQHSSNSSLAITTKKRPRSSSPTSSPAAKTPSRFNDRGGLLHPQLDPGSELWGRYSLSGSTPRGHALPALAQLMNTSSPQVSKERAGVRAMPGFRRANSCGNQFPKRRRIGGPDVDIFPESSVTSGPSRLSVLIERVQEGLVQPKKPHDETNFSRPSSSSQGQFSDDNQVCIPFGQSPLPKSTTLDNSQCELRSAPKNIETTHRSTRSEESDYGEFDDDDLDDLTLLDNVQRACGPFAPSDEPLSRTAQQAATANVPRSKGFNDKNINDNEFEDSDEDLFAADLEHLVVEFDSQHQARANKASATGQLKGTVALKADSDDEFGDGGLDDLDFAIAEAAATQSRQQKNSSFLPVRTKFP